MHDSQGHGKSATALLELVPSKEATHRAVRDGAWDQPGTWQNRKVPGLGDRVVIPKGRTVIYNRDAPVALDWVRVDGKLEFENSQDTKLVLDTFVVAPTGELEIGNDQQPIRGQSSARILFTTKGKLKPSEDPKLLGRGIISHGKVNIVGADKLDHVALKQDALKGDRVLILDLPKNDARPKGWQVGDKLVLGGTSFNPNGRNENNTRFRDEVLTIAGIQGNRIKFTNDDIQSGDKRVLRFDHTRPTSIKDKVDLYVANISRNVSFETINAKDVPIQDRAHAMFMHNPDINIKNAGFYGLGRTDKKKAIDDVGVNVNGTKGNGTNQRGRYALHVHKTGVDVKDGSVTIQGNAVVDSPGWGIVQHGSKGVFSDNVVFDVAGAGLVSEDGNESGWWINNITIKTTGDGSAGVTPAELTRLKNYDLASQGEGYWLTGAAQISMRNNIAVSARGGGLQVFSKAFGIESARPVDTIPTRVLSQELQAALPANVSQIPIENVPASFLKGFQAYNSQTGVFFWQHMGNNDGQLTFNAPNLDPAYNIRTQLKDFKLWGILDRGIEFQYSTQIDLENGLIMGNSTRKGNFGIRTNGPSQDLGFNKLLIDGFREGITVPRNGRFGEDNPLVPSTLENSVLRNNDIQLSDRLSYQLSDQTEAFPDYFQIKNTKFISPSPSSLPKVRQRYAPMGGLVYQFDASDSFDPDVPASRQNSKEGIAAYGWDFDSDGTIDAYGRVVRHRFTSAGRKNYTLTVWNQQGQSKRLKQSLVAQKTPYQNLFLDGNFGTGTTLISESKFQGSTGAGFGWLTSGWSVNSSQGQGGALEVLNSRKGVAQVIYDDHNRIGRQTLSLDVKRTDRDPTPGKVTVKLWGMNGEFEAAGWRTADNGPERVGTLPFEKKLLLDKTAIGGKNSFQKFRWNLDLGTKGYDFLVVQFNAENVNHAKGDTLLIDNVNLASPGQKMKSFGVDFNPDEPGSLLVRQKGTSGAYQPPVAAAVASSGLDASGIDTQQTQDDSAPAGDRTDQRRRGTQAVIRATAPNKVLRGRGGSDRLEGDDGNNILVGGRAADVMTGGAGRDRFRWFQPDHGGDRITDFNPERDMLEIHGAKFGGGLESGPLERAQFTLGTRAKDQDDRIVYDQKTGNLLFDRDGIGPEKSILLARLQAGLDLKSSHVNIL